jgi:hypothetical protein
LHAFGSQLAAQFGEDEMVLHDPACVAQAVDDRWSGNGKGAVERYCGHKICGGHAKSSPEARGFRWHVPVYPAARHARKVKQPEYR